LIAADTCENCSYYEVRDQKGGPAKTFCRKRLHSGALFSVPETKFDLKRGNIQTGKRQNIIVSYFPETKPEWWCGEFLPALVVPEA
jgi:hypothetical protein